MKRVALCALVATCALAQTTTPNLSLQLPATGENGWGTKVNQNTSIIDQYLSGNLPIPALSVSGTLTAPGLVLSGTKVTSALGYSPARDAVAIASLPTATTGTLQFVKDGVTSSDCATGGGSYLVPCVKNGGGTWTPLSIGGIGAVNADWSALSGASQILNKPALAASATTDATNASNISAGTLNAARLPALTPATASVLKGNGSTNGVVAAVHGTDYYSPADDLTTNTALATALGGKQTTGSYLTGNQSITVSGDATGSGATAISLAVSKVNGGAIPTSAPCVATNSSGQFTSTSCSSGGASTPATSSLLKGNGSANGVTAAAHGTDYYSPADDLTSNTALAAALSGKQTTGSYLTGNQTISISGDASGSGATGITLSVAKVNGATIPSSAPCVATNASSQFTSTPCGASTPLTASLLKGNGSANGVVAATHGTDYYSPADDLTTNTALTTALSGKQATGSYLTGNQSITVSGDATGSGSTAISLAVSKVNGAAVPVSAPCIATNSSGQFTSTSCSSGGASTPATSNLLKGNGSANGVTAAIAGTDYVIPAGNVASATTATNVAGGALGAVPYQSGAGATALLAGNTTTTKKFLTSTGDGTNAAAPTLATIATGDLPSGTVTGTSLTATNVVVGNASSAVKSTGVTIDSGNNFVTPGNVTANSFIATNGAAFSAAGATGTLPGTPPGAGSGYLHFSPTVGLEYEDASGNAYQMLQESALTCGANMIMAGPSSGNSTTTPACRLLTAADTASVINPGGNLNIYSGTNVNGTLTGQYIFGNSGTGGIVLQASGTGGILLNGNVLVNSNGNATFGSSSDSAGTSYKVYANGITHSTTYETAVATVTPSSTPNFDLSQGDLKLTLSANVTSSTFQNIRPGRSNRMMICQPATGGPYTFTPPTSATNFPTITSVAGGCTAVGLQSFDGSTEITVGDGAGGGGGSGTVTHTAGSLTSGQIVLGNGAADVTVGNLSGDVSTSGGTATTLATVNTGPGACGDATHVCQVTTNGKGLVTAQTAITITGGGGGTSTSFGTVVYSATPVFTFGSANFLQITLTGNVTSWTVSGLTAGMTYTIDWVQDATGGRTVAGAPAVVHGAFTPGTTASLHNVQQFISDGTNLFAVITGVTNQ